MTGFYTSVVAFYHYLRIKYSKSDGVKKVHLPKIKLAFVLRPKTSDCKTLRQVFVQREYDIDLDFTPSFIIDAGAYIGMAAVYFSNRFPKANIISIEPEKENFKILEQNTSGYQNINCLKKAISSISNQPLSVLDIDKENWGYRTKAISSVQDEKVIDSVKSISIEDLMAQFGLKSIDILKLDIEGAENEIFSHGYQNWIPKTRCMIIELHGSSKDKESINLINTMTEYGFRYSHKGENLVFKRSSDEAG